MKSLAALIVGVGVLLVGSIPALGEVKVVADRNGGDQATAAFKFERVPAPSKADAATGAKFTIADGRRDANGAEIEVLNDGKLPTENDQPAANFFFAQQTDGGRLKIDLASAIEIKQVNTYSWHPDTRGPQVYKLYASDGAAAGFNAAPAKGTDPEKCGWKLLAAVDTRPKDGDAGGQYGVSISDSGGALGKYRYLLMDISQTESDDAFGNTFYSEIDVVAVNAAAVAEAPAAAKAGPTILRTADGKYEITLDTTQSPELKEWAETKLAPVMLKWYPIIVEMLPSEGYSAPAKFTVIFEKPGRGVAATGGTRIMCATTWFKNNLEGEAIGAVVHEMVHVVQQYGRARRIPGATRAPGWLTEAIPDYIRWFIYEPESHGADRVRDPANARYDASYRVSANFLNFVSNKYDKDIAKKLNAVIRDGKYTTEIWKQTTGKTVEELAEEWKVFLQKPAAAPAAPAK